MSAPIPDPTRERIRGALLTVGAFAEALRVEVVGLSVTGPGLWETGWHEVMPAPIVNVFSITEARGWTVLAHWIEHGGHPIERHSRIGGASAVGWRVSLAGSTWSRAIASPQDHARVAELATALLVLRRWACPVRPWGLRDLQAESVDRAQREASVRALGPSRAVALDPSPIPTDYLAAHGTASE